MVRLPFIVSSSPSRPNSSSIPSPFVPFRPHRKNPSSGGGRFLANVSLFLIDEVHILHEKRGSSLEVIVSRMKSFDRSIRFVALSATVPNVDDVGWWLRGPEDEFYEAGGSKMQKGGRESEDVSKMGSAKVF